MHEFRDKAFAGASHVLEEAETLLCENNGVVVFFFWNLPNRRPPRYQPRRGFAAPSHLAAKSWPGGRISYLLATAEYLPESHQVFSDRVRRNKGDKGAGKGKGKDGKGPGKGK